MSQSEIERVSPDEVRPWPDICTNSSGVVEVQYTDPDTLARLYGVRSKEAASGLIMSAINSLGATGEEYRPFIASMTAEIEPRDAIEAMLVTQMVATHVAMTGLAKKMADQSSLPAKEMYERSMTR